MSAVPKNNRPSGDNEPSAPPSSSGDSSPNSSLGQAVAGGPSGMPDDLPLSAYSNETLLSAHVNDDQPWPAPVDFWRQSQVPEMRHEWMPPALADLFCGEAETWAADPGIYGMFGTGICAGALSNAIHVQVKEGDPRAIRAARLWLIVNAYSGSGKTPILTAMARPLEELQETLLEKVAYQQKKYIDDYDIYQKRRQAYISAQAANTPYERPDEPQRPARGRLIVKNATLEAIPDILVDQGMRGILGLYDEFTSLPSGANQYKKGGNDIEELLKLREGGRNSIDRKGVFTQVIENGMNIIGGTQPDRIRSVIKRMNLTDNGFLQRFNFYTAREAGLDLDRPAHEDFGRMTDIVQRIYEMQCDGPIRFCEEAQEIRRAFRIWVHEQRQLPWLSDAFKSHLNKYGDMFAEFCLTYHAIESADERCMTIKAHISADTAGRVMALMKDCLYQHAKSFYADIIESDSELTKHVRYLAGKILAKQWTTLDITKIAHGWTKWRTLKPWEKRAILTMLTEGGWLQSQDSRGYVEGMQFKARVHPELQAIFADYAEIEAARLEELAELKAERMPGQEG